MAIRYIGNREYVMLEILDRLRICRAADIAWLAGYSDFTFCRKKLAGLEKAGILDSVRDQRGAKCYFLTYLGLKEIGKSNSKVYEVSYTTNHALTVVSACVWLYLRDHVSAHDMFVDLDLIKYMTKKDHRPDIVLNGWAYEIELNHKPLARLRENIAANRQFAGQTWIVPDERKNIARNLASAAKDVRADINIVPLSQVYDTISAADIHSNTYRPQQAKDPQKALEELLARRSKKQTKYDKYLNGGTKNDQ